MDTVYIQLITSATLLILIEVGALHLNMEAQMRNYQLKSSYSGAAELMGCNEM